MPDIRQTQNPDEGALRIQVVTRGGNRPIQNAKISISYSGDPTGPLEEVNTDASGMSEEIALAAPPLDRKSVV